MAVKVISPRYSDMAGQKSSGSTYTPVELAAFVATQMLQAATVWKQKEIRVLDPAAGDGALLEALVERVSPAHRDKLVVYGFDTDPNALDAARKRMTLAFPDLNLSLMEQDFLEYVLDQEIRDDLLRRTNTFKPFDLVIANPPYVRTQIIGAKRAQLLAKAFGLTGRVDLYYPFLLGISQVLAEKGVAGLITSNRFMTTKSGQSVRREILSRFDVLHVWDFGDTKLFDAAVLPSVLVTRGVRGPRTSEDHSIRFTSVYETKDTPAFDVSNVFTGLSVDDGSVVKISDGRRFKVRHGVVDNGRDTEGTWRLATAGTDKWLATVDSNTWGTFRRIGKVRVGVKSTADKVFVRSDWSSLSGGRPELLRPLITRRCARRYRSAKPERAKDVKEILYPHEVKENGRRGAVDLESYPIAASYLEEHRPTLEARKYVIDAGRKWYEIWVPHDPDAWPKPKLVFPDISAEPVFWMDTEGGVVNGECYWLQTEQEGEEDLLWLALAIGNSTFIEAFYDHKFNNKLYAGRRRFITQYVEKFPLPDPSRDDVKVIIEQVKRIYEKTPSKEADELALNLDKRVWEVFGLNFEEVSR